MLDLMQIAKTESQGGDLKTLLNNLYSETDVRPKGYPNAIVWKGGKHGQSINPVCHSLTDAYALLGTIAAADILNLPFYAVPMWSQIRHDTKLESLSWFGNMQNTSIKWSTAGDAYVNDELGNKVVVMGKSGNAPLRTQAGVYCNVRPYGPITVVRCMPCLPYSQDKSKFTVNKETGIVHTEMNTPGIQMAYACRLFLKMINDTGKVGRVAFKPTQAMEDGINAGLLIWLLKDTKFEIGRKWAVNAYEEHKENIDKIISLLPKDFKHGMENWSGRIEQHIADTNYGLLIWDLIENQECVILATDLDGDRLTDLLADISDPLRAFGQKVLNHTNSDITIDSLWKSMGYSTGNGRDMTSVMYRKDGPPIHEQTLGSADAMLLRLLDGDESMGGSKKPYDPRIHFVLIRDAYLDANPNNKELKHWLDNVLQVFDKIYTNERPGFIEGYNTWEIINHWWTRPKSKLYYKEFHDPIGDYIQTLEHILRTQWFLGKHNIKYFMSTFTSEVIPEVLKSIDNAASEGAEKFLEHNKRKYNELIHLYELIDFSKFLPISGMHEWAKQTGLPLMPNNAIHPTPKQHEMFVDKVILPFGFK